MLIKKIIIYIIGCSLIIVSANFAIENYKEHYSDYISVFDGNENRYYRIPGIVISKKGTLIIYCEERTALSDTSDSNIVYKRSVNGKTWEEKVVLVNGIDSGHTMHNPVMIADDEGGLHCIYTVDYGLGDNGGGMYYIYSEDDGLSWSEPKNLTNITKPDNWYRIASGPGHGIQLSNGILIATIWMTEPSEEHLRYNDELYFIATIYSEDYGNTWHLGETLMSNDSVTGPVEAAIVEISGGTVMINTRIKGEQRYRAIAQSDTGYSHWTDLIIDENLKDPGCFGSIVSARDSLLFVNNNSQSTRENLSVRISYDNGTSWIIKKIIRNNDTEQYSAGYADIAVNSKGMVYVLYEECEDGIYSVKLCRFYTDYSID